MDPAWWVGGAREHFAYSLCDVRGAVNNGIFLDTGVLSSSGPSDLTLFPRTHVKQVVLNMILSLFDYFASGSISSRGKLSFDLDASDF